MVGHYVRQTVMANSIWIDVAGANPIIDNEVHTIVCRQDGARAFLFSKDAVELGVQDPTARKKYIEDRVPMHLKDLRKMYVSAFNIVEEYWPSRRSQRRTLDGETYRIPQLPPAKRATDTFEQTVSAARELLAEYYGVSWLVEVHKDTPAVETAG